MRYILLAFFLAAGASAHALEFMKCNSEGGRTLWASFGKRVTSGDPVIHYFPTEITLFRSATELEARYLYPRTADALKVAVDVTPTTIALAVPNGDVMRLRLYSPKSLSAYVGDWAGERAFCSIY